MASSPLLLDKSFSLTVDFESLDCSLKAGTSGPTVERTPNSTSSLPVPVPLFFWDHKLIIVTFFLTVGRCYFDTFIQMRLENARTARHKEGKGHTRC